MTKKALLYLEGLVTDMFNMKADKVNKKVFIFVKKRIIHFLLHRSRNRQFYDLKLSVLSVVRSKSPNVISKFYSLLE